MMNRYNEDGNDQNKEQANGSTNANYNEWQEYVPVYEQVLTLMGIFVEDQTENLIDESIYTYNVTSWFRLNLEGMTIDFWESFRMVIRETNTPEMMAKSRGRRGSDFSKSSDGSSKSDFSELSDCSSTSDSSELSDCSSTSDSSELSDCSSISDSLSDIASISDFSSDNLSDSWNTDLSDDDSVF